MRLAIVAALSILAAGCEGRPKNAAATTETPKRGPFVAVVDLAGGLPEQDKGGFLGLSGGSKRSFDEFLRVARDAKDGQATGVLVKFEGAAIGAARAQELGEVLAEIKAKKKVYCHADGLNNSSLMAAVQGCSSIWLSPAGEVEAIGIAAQILYLRRLLVEELHLSVDFLQVGKFKGAEEPFTRDGPSPEARASLLGVLADMRTAWAETITGARPRLTADVIEDGPWMPARAKELGFIDEVGYPDDALAALKTATGGVREQVVFGRGAAEADGDLDDLVRALAGDGSDTGPIALVRATGSIAMGSGGGLGGSAGIVEKDFDKTIAKLEKDDDVKAVVVRIDSPGGSALASDLMWHHLMKLRKKKPLVFSVGDMAASGGYYLSCSADYIFAEPMSIIGSIGVVGGKVGGGEALERIGVHVETFAANQQKPGAGARSAYSSPFVRWDEPTRARVLEGMTSVYDLFLARIVEGRSTRGRTITREKVAESAEGKVFGGKEAKARGLIDEIGGLRAAIAKARELAGLSESARIAVIGGKSGLGDMFETSTAAAAAARPAPFEILERVAPELVPYVTSFIPLVEGERTAVALPFALTVR